MNLFLVAKMRGKIVLPYIAINKICKTQLGLQSKGNEVNRQATAFPMNRFANVDINLSKWLEFNRCFLVLFPAYSSRMKVIFI